VLDEWLTAADRPRDGTMPATRRASPSPQAVAAVRSIERDVAAAASVAPGRRTTAVLVTTSVVRDVDLLFVGDSYADETLSPVG
jgi:hypothetical protein